MHSIKHKFFINANKNAHDAMLNILFTFGSLQAAARVLFLGRGCVAVDLGTDKGRTYMCPGMAGYVV
jgi:hypothetical protein